MVGPVRTPASGLLATLVSGKTQDPPMTHVWHLHITAHLIVGAPPSGPTTLSCPVPPVRV